MKELIKFFISTVLIFITCLCHSQEESRIALIIGNSNYSEGELLNPVNDAILMSETLEALGFDVILDTNIRTKSQFMSSVREFGELRSEYEVAFVYYAGHGIQIGSENYLLPTKEVYKSEFDVQDYGVNVQNILRYLNRVTDKVNILVLDACRNNPFEHKWNAQRSLENGSGLAKISPPTGSLIAFSTEAGATASDGSSFNSVYCQSLVANIQKENTSIDQVFRNVRNDVLKMSNNSQRPIEESQLVGETFYFNYKEEAKLKSLSSELDIAIEQLIEIERLIKKQGGLYNGVQLDKLDEHIELLEFFNAAKLLSRGKDEHIYSCSLYGIFRLGIYFTQEYQNDRLTDSELDYYFKLVKESVEDFIKNIVTDKVNFNDIIQSFDLEYDNYELRLHVESVYFTYVEQFVLLEKPVDYKLFESVEEVVFKNITSRTNFEKRLLYQSYSGLILRGFEAITEKIVAVDNSSKYAKYSVESSENLDSYINYLAFLDKYIWVDESIQDGAKIDPSFFLYCSSENRFNLLPLTNYVYVLSQVIDFQNLDSSGEVFVTELIEKANKNARFMVNHFENYKYTHANLNNVDFIFENLLANLINLNRLAAFELKENYKQFATATCNYSIIQYRHNLRSEESGVFDEGTFVDDIILSLVEVYSVSRLFEEDNILKKEFKSATKSLDEYYDACDLRYLTPDQMSTYVYYKWRRCIDQLSHTHDIALNSKEDIENCYECFYELANTVNNMHFDIVYQPEFFSENSDLDTFWEIYYDYALQLPSICNSALSDNNVGQCETKYTSNYLKATIQLLNFNITKNGGAVAWDHFIYSRAAINVIYENFEFEQSEKKAFLNLFFNHLHDGFKNIYDINSNLYFDTYTDIESNKHNLNDLNAYNDYLGLYLDEIERVMKDSTLTVVEKKSILLRCKISRACDLNDHLNKELTRLKENSNYTRLVEVVEFISNL